MKLRSVLFLIIANCIFSLSISGQAITTGYYPFSTSTGTLTPAGSFTTLIGTSNTNGISTLTTFGSGFEFNFAGRTHNSFSASTSGWIRLGSTGTQQYQNTVNNGFNFPVIAPYSTYLTTGSTGAVAYQITGIAPNRVFIVQWQNVTHSPYITSPVTFELRLFESTGQIQFVYGAIPTDTYGYQTGIGAYFNSINSYAAINVANPVSSSTSSYSSYVSNTNPIANGTLFQFTPDPVPPAVASNAVSFATAKCITVAFEDNSTTETYYEVWRSTDSVNYTFFKQIISSSEATTGTIYSYIDTGLPYNTIYHYRIVAHNFGATSTQWLAITDTTTFPSLSGVKHIPGDYPSIAAAFEDIKCKRLAGPLILELDSAYSPTVETYPLQFPGDTMTSPINTITIRPDTNVTSLAFVQTNNTSVFDFNRAANIIIDGRPGGIGSSLVLTIQNNSTSAPAVRFINDAHNIRMQYCRIYSSDSLSPNGAVYIGGTIFSEGNDHIIIDHCDISRATVTPRNLIYSSGTAGAENDSITISNSTLHGFNRSGPSSQVTSAINIGTANTDWRITGNSFYQDGVMTTAANMSFVYISNTSGYRFDISDNFFGGTSAQCGGAAATINGNGFVQFIYLNGGNAGTSRVRRNTFDNFTLGTSSINYAINVNGGRTDIDSNIIGNQNGNFTISLNSNSNVFMGIRSYSLDTINIFSNAIGGIYATGAPSNRTDILGIYVHNSIYLQVYDNVIGNSSHPNGIVSSAVGELFGITVEFLLNGCNAFVHDNIVANLSLQNTVLQYNNNVAGITCHEGTIPVSGFNLHINNNRIYNLSSTSRVSGPTFWIGGIYLSHSQGDCEISDNVIYNIQQTSSQGASAVGISTSCNSTGTITIQRNFVHSIDVPNGGSISGITCNGRDNIFNNMVRLGIIADSSSSQGGATIYGISVSASNVSLRKNILHNTIYIGGTNVSQNQTSTCIYIYGSAPDSVYNNIFCSTRSDTGSWGTRHTGLIIISNSIAVINYNLYYCVGNGSGFINGYANFGSWQATGADAQSLIADPVFIDPNGDTATVNLHIGNFSAAEGWGYYLPQIAIDIDGDLRSANTPTDIGADCAILSPTGITGGESPAILETFPNPFSDGIQVYVPSGNGTEFVMRIYDIAGALVVEKQVTTINNQYHIAELTTLTSGMYYLEIANEEYLGGAIIYKQ